MAIRSYSIARGATHIKGSGVVEAAHTGASTSTAAQATEATLTAAIAAAQAKGTSDASVEIDAVDAAWVLTLAALDAFQAAVVQPASMQLLLDTGAGLTRQDVLRNLDAIKKYIFNDDFPPA